MAHNALLKNLSKAFKILTEITELSSKIKFKTMNGILLDLYNNFKRITEREK